MLLPSSNEDDVGEGHAEDDFKSSPKDNSKDDPQDNSEDKSKDTDTNMAASDSGDDAPRKRRLSCSD